MIFEEQIRFAGQLVILCILMFVFICIINVLIGLRMFTDFFSNSFRCLVCCVRCFCIKCKKKQQQQTAPITP